MCKLNADKLTEEQLSAASGGGSISDMIDDIVKSRKCSTCGHFIAPGEQGYLTDGKMVCVSCHDKQA